MPQHPERGSALERLSTRLGIETRYRDQAGEWRDVPPSTLRQLCATLGPPGAERDPQAALAALESEAQAGPPAALVVEAGARRIRLPGARSMRWELHTEDGRTWRGAGPVIVAREALPAGYHRLETRWRGTTASTAIIAAPRRAYLPSGLRDDRVWGLAVQLYGLRSPRNWGVGDFGDLESLILRAAALGAGVVGVNPLHALFPEQPERASPYSPSSRLFVNPLYLHLEAIEDFAECAEARRLASNALTAALRRRLQRTALVDYDATTQLKRRILELLYRSFRTRHLGNGTSARGRAFRAFQRAGGAALRRFATFHALREALATRQGPKPWRQWPEELRDPASRAVTAFAREHETEVEFIEYAQWQAQDQLGRAAGLARDMGMGVGLYQDLAVGFDPDGADAWSFQAMTAEGWNIGAPPDAWSPKGQDWGLAPLNPRALAASGYAPLIETLRASMRHAGALRIDHVLGLQRFFWVPQGGAPADGAYVRYPFDELLGLVALESQRHRCVVVGEDLGTVPPGFSAALQRRGILSYRLLYFSRTRDGGFEPPRRYPRDALAAISTHDLPTLAGYWRGSDIALRDRLALYPRPGQAKSDRRARAADRVALLRALRREKIAVTGREPPVDAAHRFLARTPCRIVMAQIEDLLGLREQANLPGTSTEHPNWRRKLPLDIDAAFDDPALRDHAAVLAGERPGPVAPAPRATYRLQLNRGFTFADARAAIPYLARLGISHLYLSPIFEAQPDSTHGYDTTSFERINPDIGGEAGFRELAAAARAHGLKLVIDFVPNHMGIFQARNAWWLELLEWGRRAPAGTMFDVDWEPVAWPELRGRLTVPLLGDEYRQVLERGELRVRFDHTAGSFSVWYHGHCFPLCPLDYATLLAPALARPGLAARKPLARIAGDFERLATAGDPVVRATRLKAALARWAAANPARAHALQAAIDEAFNAPRRHADLDRLLARQVYRLAHWRTSTRQINYRRFFDINQLGSLRMERREVFERTHRVLAGLLSEDLVHGIRLDHVDGLYDPGQYCRRLRSLAQASRNDDTYIVVEKILGSDEALRRDWAVQGTTGYECANWLNGVLVHPDGAAALARGFRRFTGRTAGFAAELRDAKRQILDQVFGGELLALAARVSRIVDAAAGPRWHRSDVMATLRDIIVEVPIYRTYIGESGTTAADAALIGAVLARARRRRQAHDAALFRILDAILTAKLPRGLPPAWQDEVRDVAIRVQQLTAPVQAKSLEDTAFYRYVPLLSVNEVGGDPEQPALEPASFHARMQERARNWPHAMTATATHDTKRGEDARARLSVLSEIPRIWQREVTRWAAMNHEALGAAGGERAPSAKDEYMIYQSLLGAWPMEFTEGPLPGENALAELRQRLSGFVEKAVREAKQRSSWLEPNAAYEEACKAFVARVLHPRARRFLTAFSRFAAVVARWGALNSLSQTVLKFTMPGVPDLYRGCELWDLSLVDPDNRRPFSLDERREVLAGLGADGADVPGLTEDWRSGRLKLFLTWRLLAARRACAEVFEDGSYEPLRPTGPAADHVIAFRRQDRDSAVIVAVGRHFATLAPRAHGFVPPPRAWGDTRLARAAPRANGLVDALTGRPVRHDNGTLSLAELFHDLPVAVLRSAA